MFGLSCLSVCLIVCLHLSACLYMFEYFSLYVCVLVSLFYVSWNSIHAKLNWSVIQEHGKPSRNHLVPSTTTTPNTPTVNNPKALLSRQLIPFTTVCVKVFPDENNWLRGHPTSNAQSRSKVSVSSLE